MVPSTRLGKTTSVCCFVLLNQYWGINVWYRGFFKSRSTQRPPSSIRRTYETLSMFYRSSTHFMSFPFFLSLPPSLCLPFCCSFVFFVSFTTLAFSCVMFKSTDSTTPSISLRLRFWSTYRLHYQRLGWAMTALCGKGSCPQNNTTEFQSTEAIQPVILTLLLCFSPSLCLHPFLILCLSFPFSLSFSPSSCLSSFILLSHFSSLFLHHSFPLFWSDLSRFPLMFLSLSFLFLSVLSLYLSLFLSQSPYLRGSLFVSFCLFLLSSV